MFCQSLLYIGVNQLYVYISPSSWTSLPPLLPSHPSRSSQSTKLTSLCYAAGGIYMVVYIYTYMCNKCITRGSVYMSILISQFVPPSLPSLCPHVHFLCLHFYSCPGNIFSYRQNKKKRMRKEKKEIVLVKRTHRICSFNNSLTYHTAMLAIVIMLYINWMFVPFEHFSPISPSPALCLWKLQV